MQRSGRRGFRPSERASERPHQRNNDTCRPDRKGDNVRMDRLAIWRGVWRGFAADRTSKRGARRSLFVRIDQRRRSTPNPPDGSQRTNDDATDGLMVYRLRGFAAPPYASNTDYSHAGRTAIYLFIPLGRR